MTFGTNNVERLRITSGGLVGIGTDDPQVQLTVSSTSPAVCDIHHKNGGTNDEARIILGALANNPPSNRGAGIAAVNNGAGHDLIVKCSASHSAGPTEKMRIDSSGKIILPTGSPGIQFGSSNTGTNITSQTLDDYEEGTWTPVLNKVGTTGTVSSPTSAIGVYRKVGSMLFLSFYYYKVAGSTFGTGSYQWYISGLPFNCISGITAGYQSIHGGYHGINGVVYNITTAAGNRWQVNGVNNDATLTLYGVSSADNWASGYIEFSGSGVLTTS